MTVHDAKEAIDFYVKAFGAVEQFRLVELWAGVGHAEIRIGDSVLMMNDEYPDFGARSPASVGGSPVAFHIQVPDADAAVDRAVKAGATVAARRSRTNSMATAWAWWPVRSVTAGRSPRPRSR